MTGQGAAVVLDASALLAYVLGEAGRSVVEDALTAGAIMSAVNYAEALSRLVAADADIGTVAQMLSSFGLGGYLLTVVPFGPADAVAAARLRAPTRALGLSLGDRACLAVALRFGAAALTADRAWATLDVGVEVRLLRP